MTHFFNSCRLCKTEKRFEQLARYGVRHYAHFSCGLAKWGAAFLTMIPMHEIGRIPFRLVAQYHLENEPAFRAYVERERKETA